MQFEEQQQQGVLVVRPLEKSLDATNIQEFREYMVGRVQAGNHLIAFDLAEVEFIDSSGLGGIISVLKSVGEDGNVALFGVDDNVRSLFKLTRTDRIFPILPSIGGALLALVKN
ncbi:MAG: STAS domain-containing protein [Desulfuromonadales bacterium]